MWYKLDVNDRVTAVSDDWDAMSIVAGAPEATLHKIRYRPIWDFIRGTDTQRFLRAVFFLARSKQQPLSLPYLMEDNGTQQPFIMRIEPLQTGGIVVRHAPEPNVAHPDPSPLIAFTTADMMCCSQCLRIHVDGQWYQPEPNRRLLEHSDWRVCPDCKTQALDLIHAAPEHPVASPAYARFGKS